MAITKNAGRQNILAAEVTFNGGTDVTSTGTYEAIDLPVGALICGAQYEVLDTFTGTGTVAVQVGAAVLLAANNGDAAGVTTAAEGDIDVPTLTATDTVDVVVATAALTDGQAKVVVFYTIADRATEAQ